MRLVIPFLLATALPAQWPQFRGNPQLTGISPENIPAQLKVLWTYEAGDAIESSPAIDGGMVYIGAQTQEILGARSCDGEAEVEIQDQRGDWRVVASRSGRPGAGGRSGRHAIRRECERRKAGVEFFRRAVKSKSSPVVVGDRVLIGSYDGSLYCLDLKTGKQIWSYATNGPVACDSRGAGWSRLHQRLRRSVSRHQHQRRQADVRDQDRLLHGGVRPRFLGDMFFVGSYGNEVFGLDRKAKKGAWRYEHPTRKFPFYSSAAIWQGKVILGGRDKLVHAFEAKTGKSLWEFTTRSRVESSPAVAQGRVYVGSNDGRLYVLDAAKGTKLFEFEAGSPVSSSPALGAGKVVIATQDGKGILAWGRTKLQIRAFTGTLRSTRSNCLAR